MNIVSTLQTGGIGVMPTDTIYGVLGQAMNQKTVERIYAVRYRQPDKPFIILISSLDSLAVFDIFLSNEDKKLLEKYWPGMVSVVLSCDEPRLAYLHRGTKTLAFRLPNNPELLELLKSTGPLVAPSANPEGLPPANNIDEARTYFGEKVDFYKDAGDLRSLPPTLVKLENGKLTVLREGVVKIED